jgi:N-acetylglutamate synthase-like GNAT family acetyltransferase
MEIADYDGEIDELYGLWTAISRNIPFAENISKKNFKSTYFEDPTRECICLMASEEDVLKGCSIINILPNWGAVFFMLMPRGQYGSEMSTTLLAETIDRCRKAQVSKLWAKPMVGRPWAYEFLLEQGFQKAEDMPEGFWMRANLDSIPEHISIEGVKLYFTEDLEESGDLVDLAQLETNIGIEEYNYETDLVDNIEALRQEMQQSNVVYGIARTESKSLAGFTRTIFAELLSGDTIAKNQGLAVTKSERRKGIAEALLVDSMHMIKEKGHAAAYISTHSKNPARFLYGKVGFEIIETVPNLVYDLD